MEASVRRRLSNIGLRMTPASLGAEFEVGFAALFSHYLATTAGWLASA